MTHSLQPSAASSLKKPKHGPPSDIRLQPDDDDDDDDIDVPSSPSSSNQMHTPYFSVNINTFLCRNVNMFNNRLFEAVCVQVLPNVFIANKRSSSICGQ